MKEEKESRSVLWNVIWYSAILIMLYVMVGAMLDHIGETIPRENNCLEEESYYYRIEGTGGLLGGSRKVETTKENSDGISWRCLEWEHDTVGVWTGQDLVWDKGNIPMEEKK